MQPWSFIHVTDIHIGSPKSFRFQPAYNDNWLTARSQIVALKPDLLLVGGDLTRDGFYHDFELEAVKADLSKLPFPYHVIPGNMDVGNKIAKVRGPMPRNNDLDWNMTSETLGRFARVFGPLNWSFVHKNVRFSGCWAAVTGSGLPEEQTFWRWLEALPSPPAAKHHVLVMHYALFIDRMDEANFNQMDPEQYGAWYFSVDHPHRDRMFDLLKRAKVEIVLSGHIHCRKPVQIVDGVQFYKGPSTAKSQWRDRWPDGDPTLGFQRFTVSDAGIAYEFVPLEKLSRRDDGYGMSGHPKPEERDYSLAREK